MPYINQELFVLFHKHLSYLKYMMLKMMINELQLNLKKQKKDAIFPDFHSSKSKSLGEHISL